MGTMVTRKHRELSEVEIKSIFDTYHSWKCLSSDYKDTIGFCKSTSLDEVRGHEYILTPGRYVGFEDKEDDGELFGDKMTRLTGELAELIAKSHDFEDKIRKQLEVIGYDI